jgi:hypothetical protein
MSVSPEIPIMANEIDKTYDEAVETQLLPGVCAIAGDKDGRPA